MLSNERLSESRIPPRNEMKRGSTFHHLLKKGASLGFGLSDRNSSSFVGLENAVNLVFY